MQGLAATGNSRSLEKPPIVATRCQVLGSGVGRGKKEHNSQSRMQKQLQGESRERIELQQQQNAARSIMGKLHIFQIASFTATCHSLLPAIREGWRSQGHERHLPANVMAFLCGHLHLTVEEVCSCWTVVKTEVLKGNNMPFRHLIATPHSSVDGIRRLYTLDLRKGSSELYVSPKTLTRIVAAITLDIELDDCPEAGCHRKLVRKGSLKATLLTMAHGKVPVLCPSMYCNGTCVDLRG